MDHISIPKKYSEYKLPSKRHKNKVRHEYKAGWILDFTRNYELKDNLYDYYINQIDTKIRSVTEYGKKLIIENKKKEQEKIKKEKESEKINQLAALRVKYTPQDLNSEIWKIKDSILGSCKYLTLADSMQQTRNDWTDGPYLVENSLGSFEISSDLDKKIYACIENVLIGFSDGREFRDCEYSYDVLFSYCDQDLFNDYQLLESLQ